MKKIIVLGAGIGGIPMAYELRDELKEQAEITVVSDLPYFEFTPSNPWVAVNWRKKEQIRVELAEVFAKRKIKFIHSAAKKLSLKVTRWNWIMAILSNMTIW